MNTTEQIKQYILHDCKMDAVGIAPVSAFDYENGLHTPEHILPNAKSVIVFTKRIPEGSFRQLSGVWKITTQMHTVFTLPLALT